MLVAPPSGSLHAAAPVQSAVTLETLADRIARLKGLSNPNIGLAESQVIQWATYRWTRRLLERERYTHPDIVLYWVRRSRVARFASDTNKLVEKLRPGSDFAAHLKQATDKYREMEKMAEVTRYHSDINHADKTRLLKTFKDPRHRRLVQGLVQSLLDDLGELDPETNDSWRPFYEYLHGDIFDHEHWAEGELNKDLKVQKDMAQVFLDGLYEEGRLDVVSKHEVSALMRFDAEEASYLGALFMTGLGPQDTPRKALASAYLDYVMAFDSWLTDMITRPNVIQSDRHLDDLCTVFPCQISLRRRAAWLRHGYQILAVDLLSTLPDRIIDGQAFSRRLNDEEQEQMRHTRERLKEFAEDWRRNGKLASPLFAVVLPGPNDTIDWQWGGWLAWEWVTDKEVKDWRRTGRVVDAFDMVWLLPADAVGRVPDRFEALLEMGAKQVILALSPWILDMKAALEWPSGPLLELHRRGYFLGIERSGCYDDPMLCWIDYDPNKGDLGAVSRRVCDIYRNHGYRKFTVSFAPGWGKPAQQLTCAD